MTTMRSALLLGSLLGLAACTAAQPPPMPLTASQTARVCTLLDLCGGSIPDCINNVPRLTRQGTDAVTRSLIDCATSAMNCETYVRCVTGNRPNEGGSRCEGNTLLSTAGGVLVPISCADWSGGTCMQEGSIPRCVSSAMCDRTMPARCDGTRLIDCSNQNSLLHAIDCSRIYPNGRCSATSTGAVCVPTNLPACSTVGTTCMGNTLVRCANELENGGIITAGAWDSPRSSTLDCASVGGTCVATGETARCVPSATACDPSSAQPRCNGTDLEVCVQGSWQTVSCPSLGHPYCIQPMNGAGSCSLTPPMMR